MNKLESNLESLWSWTSFCQGNDSTFLHPFQKICSQITAGYWQPRRQPTRLAAAREKSLLASDSLKIHKILEANFAQSQSALAFSDEPMWPYWDSVWAFSHLHWVHLRLDLAQWPLELKYSWSTSWAPSRSRWRSDHWPWSTWLLNLDLLGLKSKICELSWCLKITEKVSFNVYNLNGQKLI